MGLRDMKSGHTLRLRGLTSSSPWRILRALFLIGLTVAVLGAGGIAAVWLVYASDPDLPRLDRAADYKPKVVTHVLAQDGELIGEIFEERRTVVPRQKIPDVMMHALIDAEDAGFFEHAGLSYWGMLRALLYDLKPGGRMQGASTLTQQLVRNVLLKTNARTLKRKIQEMILARRLEQSLSKDEILTIYLNQIAFPYQRFGVEEASCFYFGKSISDVDAGEAAVLASLPKGFNIDPVKHPDRAKERQKYVLSQMVRYHHLTEAEAEKFARAPIRLVKNANPYLGSAPEFVDQVRKVLDDRFGAKEVATLGLNVVTTCDARIQKLTREAVEKGLQNLDERHGYRKPLAHLSGKAFDAHVKQLVRDYGDEPGMDKIVDGVVTEVSKEEGGFLVSLGKSTGVLPLPLIADRYNPKKLPPEKCFSPGDVIRVRILDHKSIDERPVPMLALELGPQAAAVVIDPETRQVKAMVGGYGFRQGSFNRARVAQRQPGSAFKPFVYAAAFGSERFTPASVLVDGPQVYTQPGMAPWKPQNAEKEEYLGPVRLRTALARSLNTVASQLVDVERGGISPEVVAELAKNMGIESHLEATPSIALGASAVTPLEMADAYATFAAQGQRRALRFIQKIGDAPFDGESETSTEAVKPEVAFLVTSMMTSVIEEGTAASARGKLGRPAAGKTGTTNSRKDAWFVGFTPDLVVSVWVGFDDMRELGRGEQGSRAALPIWLDIMQGALKGKPPRPFAQPPGIVVAKIDPASGLLAEPGAANAVDEYFLAGTEPKETAAAGEANPDNFMNEQEN